MKIPGVLAALFLFIAGSALAQVQNPIVFPGVPTGACGPPNTAVNQSNGDFYTCASSAWVKVGSSGGGTIPVLTQGQLVVGTISTPVAQQKAIYDSRDWMTCDGATDTSAGLHTLLTAIGTQEATVRFIGNSTPGSSCRVGNTLFPANVTLDFSGGGALTLISSTTTPGNAVFVQATSTECGSGATCSLPAITVTAGNTLVVADAPYPGFTFKITSVTDTCGDFFIHVFQSLVNQPRNQGLWVASGATGGSCTITAHANGSLTTNMMNVSEWSGMGPVVSPDGKGASANQINSTMTSGAAATTAGSLLIGFGGQPFTSETCTAGAGFTQPAGLAGQSSSGFMCMEYQLSSAGGNVTATQNITSSANWVYSQVPLKVGNATASIFGGIIDPDLHQIFFNADGATGHGVVDFTNNTGITTVYPEWWGAGNSSTAANNTLALQAAEYGAFGGGPLPARPNGSGLNIFNKTLYLTSNYSINDELKFYDVISFKVVCANRLNSGITQTQANKRIIDGQSVAYGAFYDCGWTGSASSTNALIDLDFNGVTTAGDLAPQFIDFYNNGFFGSSLVDSGVLIAKSGGNAQGSNIYCYDCLGSSFTGAVWQIGGDNTGRNAGRFGATNAIDIGWWGGDMQGNPLYGLSSVAGGHIFLENMTMENGFATQTGFDMFCSQGIGSQPCVMRGVRSESRRLISASYLDLRDSYTIDQSTLPTPGTSDPVGTIIKGDIITGDGQYYKVTTDTPPFPGAGSFAAPLHASGGSGTTLQDTNDTIPGAVTIKLFTAGDALTQAVSGSTATVLTAAASTATVTGTLTSGLCNGTETMTQAITGITGTELFPTPSASVPLSMNNLSGTADNSHIWTGGTTGCTFTPSAAPAFSAATMVVTLPTGSPDGTHNWTNAGGSTFVPSGSPAAEANWTVNAFTGLAVGIPGSATATNPGCYGIITSNTANTVTFSGGWLNKYVGLTCGTPDTTSKFFIECYLNGGGVINCGTMVVTALNEKGIEGGGSGLSAQGILENVVVPGDQLNLTSQGTTVRNLIVTRPDWLVSNGAFQQQGSHDWDAHLIENIAGAGGGAFQNWSYVGNGSAGRVLSVPFQKDLSTAPITWNVNFNGGPVALTTWIGGRSDPNSQGSTSRAVLEYGGMLGRATPVGTDKSGTATQIQGGLPTGAGTPGNIEFWEAPGGGGSGATAQDGAAVVTITPTGLSTVGQFTSSKATGTAPLVITSTTPVANLTTVPITYDHSGNQQTAAHLVQDSCVLGTSCSVTLTGASVYTSSTSYTCVCEDSTAIAACKVAQSSGSAFVITGTGTDTIRYHCVGN